MNIFLIFFFLGTMVAENITVVGVGYVGLVTGAVLSNIGHDVVCYDINQTKIEYLKNKQIPFFEPGLQELVTKNINDCTLKFSHLCEQAYRNCKVAFIAVDTPRLEDGSADLKNLILAVECAINNLENGSLICIKSTVTPGTNDYIKKLILKSGKNILIASNPEFLREGSAINDFLSVNPIVVGGETQAREILKNIYGALIDLDLPWIEFSKATEAEFTKYAWNSFGALKVCYVNELSHYAKALDLDIKNVIKAISYSDNLLPIKKIIPGPGIGGSCFPKDVDSLGVLGKKLNLDLPIIYSILESSIACKNQIINEIENLAKNFAHKPTIGILGLSFKANTDDIRYSPAIDFINYFLLNNYKVQCFDPRAADNMKKIYPSLYYGKNIEEAIDGVDIILILTDWREIKDFDYTQHFLVNNKTVPLIVDTRYCLLS
jgi:UDPglucose 6-dehydrogenase